MSEQKQDSSHSEMTREELERLLKMDSEPLDLEELERAGIIEKRGGWYLVKGELPEKAARRASALKSSPEGTMVKFRRVKGTKRSG